MTAFVSPTLATSRPLLAVSYTTSVAEQPLSTVSASALAIKRLSSEANAAVMPSWLLSLERCSPSTSTTQAFAASATILPSWPCPSKRANRRTSSLSACISIASWFSSSSAPNPGSDFWSAYQRSNFCWTSGSPRGFSGAAAVAGRPPVGAGAPPLELAPPMELVSPFTNDAGLARRRSQTLQYTLRTGVIKNARAWAPASGS
jgi:hypothetical protein